MTAVCLIHAPADRDFASGVCHFLEAGCDVVCYPDEGGNIIEQAERLGLSGDVLVVILSKGNCSAGWPDRARWESVLVRQAREGGVDVVFLQLDDCAFPSVFKKQFPFFDTRPSRSMGMRLLKRWLWQRQLGSGESAHAITSTDLEWVYDAVADRAGYLEVSGAVAKRFAAEASQEFAARRLGARAVTGASRKSWATSASSCGCNCGVLWRRIANACSKYLRNAGVWSC